MNDSEQELLRGALDMLILKVLVLGPHHGYAMAQRLQQMSREFFQVHPSCGSQRLVAIRMERIRNRPASQVLLSDQKGSRHMNAEVIHWQRLSEAVGLVLRREEESS
jgi:PadR family transcriptional regulator PadR